MSLSPKAERRWARGSALRVFPPASDNEDGSQIQFFHSRTSGWPDDLGTQAMTVVFAALDQNLLVEVSS